MAQFIAQDQQRITAVLVNVGRLVDLAPRIAAVRENTHQKRQDQQTDGDRHHDFDD
ncbi:MAG: hypothetical protein M3495_00795 [Pseudomonadota bacterium]|nr:hypothetical protein [Gammaproteobacteria bacterium]MDQ3580240.1 hypothetical protein [Pseudomonadota bacterium]